MRASSARSGVALAACMTPHDTFASVNLYFLSFPALWLDAGKS